MATEPSDAEIAERITAGAAKLAVPVSGGDVARLVAYVRLLERWNAAYNLTAVREPLAMVTHHVLDSLAAAAALLRHRRSDGRGRLLDVGSGAGLPGLVIAVACPATEVLCIDKVAKKTAFVVQAAASLGLGNVEARHIAVEALSTRPFDVIASRAVGSLATLVTSSRHLLDAGGEWMAMKGKTPAKELKELHGVLFHVEPLGVPFLEAERCIVWMRPNE